MLISERRNLVDLENANSTRIWKNDYFNYIYYLLANNRLRYSRGRAFQWLDEQPTRDPRPPTPVGEIKSHGAWIEAGKLSRTARAHGVSLSTSEPRASAAENVSFLRGQRNGGSRMRTETVIEDLPLVDFCKSTLIFQR